MRARNPAGHAGLVSNLLALLTDLVAFAEARIGLFIKESRRAASQGLVLIACLVLALLFFGLGYIFVIAGAISIIARATEVSWAWIALAAGGVHFLFALVFLIVARTRMIKRPFTELTEELKKDREWLRNLDQTSRPTK